MRGRAVLAAVCVAPLALGAQARVEGLVYDSLARRPLAGATVQVVARGQLTQPPHTAVADETGHFRVAGLSPGRYLLGASHRELDSLGLDQVTSEVAIAEHDSVVAVFMGVPGARQLATLLCGAPQEHAGVIFGRVRDADGASMDAGTVRASWAELVVDQKGVRSEPRDVRVPLGPLGRFLLCAVPTGVTVHVHADADSGGHRARVSSGEIGVRVDSLVPVAHRDLFVGVTRDRATAVLTGTVRDSTGAPVLGASVSIPDLDDPRATARTDTAGRYRMAALPAAGSRAVVARAMGHVITRGSANLLAGGETTLDLQLGAMAVSLPEVNVRANALDPTGFLSRKAGGSAVGEFITAESIASGHFVSINNVLANTSMLRIRDTNARGYAIVGGPRGCAPTYIVDGAPVRLEPHEVIDDWIRPRDVWGIEVYPGSMGVPPQLVGQASACVTVLIWSKLNRPPG